MTEDLTYGISMIRLKTKTKKKTDKLGEAEMWNRILFEASPDALFVVDPDRRILEVNEAAVERYGYGQEELLSMKVDDLAAPDLRDKAPDRIRMSLAQSHQFEWRHVCKDGREIDVEINSKTIQLNNQRLVLSSVRDISERKRSEEALLEERNWFAKIVDTSPGAICSFIQYPDGSARFPYASPAIQDVYGLDPKDLARDASIVRDLIHPDDHERVREAISDSARTLLAWRDEFRFRHPLKGEVWIESHFKPSRGEDGSVTWYGVVTDITERKRAEKALKKSEERYTLVMDGINDGIWDWNVQTDEVYFSPHWKSMLGFKDDEIGNDFSEWESRLHPDEADEAKQTIQDYFDGKTSHYSLEHRLRHKDNSYRWILARGAAIFNESGKPVRMSGSHTNITDRKKTEDALIKQEIKLANAMEIAHLGPWEYDVADDLFTFNDLFYKLFRTTAEQVGGYAMSSAEYSQRFVHPEDAAAVGNEIRQAIETTEPFFSRQIEHRIIYGDGAVGHIEVRFFIVKDERGRTIKTYGVNQDITERKLAEETLRLSAVRWSNTFDAISDIVCIISLDNEIIEINKTGCDAIGLPKEEILGRKCFSVVHGTDAPIPDCPVKKTMKTGQPNRNIHSHEGRHLELAAWPIFGPGKRMEGIVHIMKDITQEVEREKEKEKLEGQLRQAQKMEAIGRLAGGVAHDFNNILTAITGFADLMYMSLAADDPLRDDVDQIMQAADRAASLTQQLLAFSRKQIIAPRIIDLNKAVSTSKMMLTRIIGENIDLLFVPFEKLWNIKLDPSQVDQILINLAVNSRDAIPDVGKLTIETGNVTLDQESCQSCPESITGDFVLLAVSDNGAGMDPETVNKIFEPFFTTKKKGKGTGLGLAMVHGIVHQNAGHVNVYSEPGMGATFKIYFPRIAEALDVLERPVQSIDMEGNETILLVEDQEIVRKLARRILEQMGYTVLEADDGGEAFLVFEKYDGEIHLLLTDVVMPRMNGRELYERMAKVKPELKVLYMSGYTENAIAHHGVLDEGTNFIQKPFRPNELAQKVREVLNEPPAEKGDESE